jgi:Iron dependent repressor, N-terminal DNA binding domain
VHPDFRDIIIESLPLLNVTASDSNIVLIFSRVRIVTTSPVMAKERAWAALECSPFPKLLTQSSCSVVKLTDRKIRWIIKEKSKDVLSTADIARLQNVSESRVRQLLSEYRKTGYIHVLPEMWNDVSQSSNQNIDNVDGGSEAENSGGNRVNIS